MGTLLIKLAGPMQSWGAESRYTERKTRHEPTKSGIVGLLASALGRRREELVDDLACLRMAVRIDQFGKFGRDFQTAHTRKFDKLRQSWVFDKSLPLSNRYYLLDAVFVAGIEMPDDLLDTFASALLHPAFPLYLGRRSCPPATKVLLDTREGVSLMEALKAQPWEASNRQLLKECKGKPFISCEVLRDCLSPEDELRGGEPVRDYPVSFSQIDRQYEWRTVIHDTVQAPNPHYVGGNLSLSHDPISALEEV